MEDHEIAQLLDTAQTAPHPPLLEFGVAVWAMLLGIVFSALVILFGVTALIASRAVKFPVLIMGVFFLLGGIWLLISAFAGLFTKLSLSPEAMELKGPIRSWRYKWTDIDGPACLTQNKKVIFRTRSSAYPRANSSVFGKQLPPISMPTAALVNLLNIYWHRATGGSLAPVPPTGIRPDRIG